MLTKFNQLKISFKRFTEKFYTLRIYPLIVIIILSFIPWITWFVDGYFICRSDIFPQFNAVWWFEKQVLYIWSGFPHVLVASDAANLPFFGFWASLLLFNVPPLIIQRLLYFLVLLFSGLSAYYLVSFFIRERISRLIASIFYMFNSFSIISYGIESSAIAYFALPLLAGLLLRGLKEKKNKYVFLFAIVSFLTTPIATNFTNFMSIWIVLLIFYLYHLIFIESRKLSSIFYGSKILLIYLIVNTFWITGLIISLQSKNITIQPQISVTSVYLNSQKSSILNVFRLGLVSYIFFIPNAGYPYSIFYSTPISIIATLTIPILAFSAIALYPRNKNVIYFSIISLLFIFLAKGTHPPLESVNRILYQHIPGFIIFREPWKNFDYMIVSCFALLIGYTADKVIKKIKKLRVKLKREIIVALFLFLVFFAIFASAWPLVTGDHFTRTGISNSHVKIPSYWFEANNWFNSQNEDFRILLTPRNTQFTHYNWESISGMGAHIVYGRETMLINKPLLFYMPVIPYYMWGRMYHVINMFYDIMHLNTTKLLNYLSLLNVKYILQRNDLDWTYYNSTDLGSPEFIRNTLEAQEGIHFKRSFGKLYVYEVENKYVPPSIYGSCDVFKLSEFPLEKPLGIRWIDYVAFAKQIKFYGYPEFDQKMLSIVLSKRFIPGQTAIVFSSPLDFKKIFVDRSYKPIIRSQKVNPTQYYVHVETDKPFLLIFSETFHSGWKIYEGKINWIETLWKKPLISEKYHLMVNGYANGWYINKTGSYVLTVYFEPQTIYYIGWIISLSAMAFSSFFLISCIFNIRIIRILQKFLSNKKSI